MDDDTEAIADFNKLVKEKNQEKLNTNIAERINAAGQLIGDNEQDTKKELPPPSEEKETKSKKENKKEAESNQPIDNKAIEQAKNEINKEIKRVWLLDEIERKKEIKKLFLKWHPDKNQGKENLTTEVFKFLKKQIEENMKNLSSASNNSTYDDPDSEDQDSDDHDYEDYNFESQDYGDQEYDEFCEYDNYYETFDSYMFRLAQKYNRYNTSNKTKIIKPTRVYRSRKSIQDKCYDYYFIDDDSIKDDEENHFCLFLNDTYDDYKVKGSYFLFIY
jgi:hypothetical protein